MGHLELATKLLIHFNWVVSYISGGSLELQTCKQVSKDYLPHTHTHTQVFDKCVCVLQGFA